MKITKRMTQDGQILQFGLFLLVPYKQWGYTINIKKAEIYIAFPIAFPTAALTLSEAITGFDVKCAADNLTKSNFRYYGSGQYLPNIRWISIGY